MKTDQKTMANANWDKIERETVEKIRLLKTEWIALNAKLERERNNLLIAMREIVACGLNCKDALDEAEQMERIAKEALSSENK